MSYENIYSYVGDRLNLSADRLILRGSTIYAHYDSDDLWESSFVQLKGLQSEIIRAFMLGFASIVFVSPEGKEHPTPTASWLTPDRRRRRRQRG